MPTKAYDQKAVDQMLADLRALDENVVYLESAIRAREAYLKSDKAELAATKRKQKALAAKVWRIQAAKEKG